MIRPQPRPTLFPYTTLFRSKNRRGARRVHVARTVGTDRNHKRLPITVWFGESWGPQLRGPRGRPKPNSYRRSEEHTSELQSRGHLVCRLLLEKKKKKQLQHM